MAKLKTITQESFEFKKYTDYFYDYVIKGGTYKTTKFINLEDSEDKKVYETVRVISQERGYIEYYFNCVFDNKTFIPTQNITKVVHHDFDYTSEDTIENNKESKNETNN